jgi:hypothetical protein
VKNINDIIDIIIKIGDVAKQKLSFLYVHHMMEGILSMVGRNLDRNGSITRKNPNKINTSPIIVNV